jgi:hypothetical protein
MKGMELPVNALVIILIAVLVLLGIVALWMGGWVAGAQGVTIEAAKAAACSELMRYYLGCTALEPYTIGISNFDANKNGAILSGILPGDWCWAIGVPGGALACPAKSVCGTTSTGKDNLASLCSCYYSAWTASDCRKLCGCGG